MSTKKGRKAKVVCIGDGAVGKTCLLISYTKGEFPEDYVPTIFDNYSATVKTKSGESILLNLWDTAGQEDYDHIRALAYKDVDCFLICFSLLSQVSLSNVRQKWWPSITDSESSEAKIVLCGTKEDLRTDRKAIAKLAKDGKAPVTKEQGEKLAAEMGASAYVECSALLGTGLKECVQAALNASLKRQAARNKGNSKKEGCTIL